MHSEEHNSKDYKFAVGPQAVAATGTVTGAILDTKGKGTMEIIAQLGTITDGSYSLVVNHGDEADLSDAAVVDASLLITNSEDNASLSGAGDSDKVIAMACISKKRYVRVDLVATGVTTGVDAAAVLVAFGKPRNEKV